MKTPKDLHLNTHYRLARDMDKASGMVKDTLVKYNRKTNYYEVITDKGVVAEYRPVEVSEMRLRAKNPNHRWFKSYNYNYLRSYYERVTKPKKDEALLKRFGLLEKESNYE